MATTSTDFYTLSLHDALPISTIGVSRTLMSSPTSSRWPRASATVRRSEEHTSELQSLRHLVCRLLLEKKKKKVQVSENYERFKAGYEKKAILRFGIYKEGVKK